MTAADGVVSESESKIANGSSNSWWEWRSFVFIGCAVEFLGGGGVPWWGAVLGSPPGES